MKKIGILCIGLILICVVPSKGQFVLSKQGDVRNPYMGFLGLGLKYAISNDKVPFWARDRNSLLPGDYYIWPTNARPMDLSNGEKKEISNTLVSLINKNLYDSMVISNISGCYYEMGRGTIKRREFYIRYSQADTVYVISGQVGKFLSFYRTIPGTTSYSNKDLRSLIKGLANGYFLDKDGFSKIDTLKGRYFIEYYDRKNLIRVRAYSISEVPYDDWIKQISIGKPRTLIEITKFLDKEVMP